MDSFEHFEIHNLFKSSLDEFKARDPHLRRIASLPFNYLSPLAEAPNFKIPGIYLITGGRQVGKTTFLKQYILQLLETDHIAPDNILFMAGELIDNHHTLISHIEAFSKPEVLQYIFIDEINYIPDWDKGIKYLADSGYLENSVMLLTGSDSLILRTAMQRFAGRRGNADTVDYIFYPLSFREFVLLKNPGYASLCESVRNSPITDNNALYTDKHPELLLLLNLYLIHGGYLPAIANYWQEGTVYPGTVRTYIEWIMGDMLKLNKTEKHVIEILRGILTTYSSQISWHSLQKHLSIEHHQTVSDYCHILESIHVLYIVQAIDENRLSGAPKKNKKIYFQDPFIYHAVSALISHNLSFDNITESLNNPKIKSELIEGVVISHCERKHETYYIKGSKGEVDVAIIVNNKFIPIEVKWTAQLREDELKQVQSYHNGIILWNRDSNSLVGKTPVIPLPKFLLNMN